MTTSEVRAVQELLACKKSILDGVCNYFCLYNEVTHAVDHGEECERVRNVMASVEAALQAPTERDRFDEGVEAAAKLIREFYAAVGINPSDLLERLAALKTVPAPSVHDDGPADLPTPDISGARPVKLHKTAPYTTDHPWQNADTPAVSEAERKTAAQPTPEGLREWTLRPYFSDEYQYWVCEIAGPDNYSNCATANTMEVSLSMAAELIADEIAYCEKKGQAAPKEAS